MQPILKILINYLYKSINKDKKMVKKGTTNTDSTEEKIGIRHKIKTINADTQIVFTVKSFLGTIITILTIFFGFYEFVILPKVNSSETHYHDMFNDQKEQNRIFYEKLGKINTSIGALNSTIEAINRVNANNNNSNNNKNSNNTKGSFSDNTNKTNNYKSNKSINDIDNGRVNNSNDAAYKTNN